MSYEKLKLWTQFRLNYNLYSWTYLQFIFVNIFIDMNNNLNSSKQNYNVICI